jgi:ketosteroid isomerase-like protein
MTTFPVRGGDATRALAAHLDRIGRDIPAWLELFDADAIVEFPYAASIGAPPRLDGLAAIERYFRGTPDTFRGLAFRDLRLASSEDPELAIAEVRGSARIGPTGQPYEQDYVMFLRTKHGLICHYREYWNPVPAITAFGGSVSLPERRMAP